MTPGQGGRYLKLPFSFDAARLMTELQALAAPAWMAHPNRRDYQGDWQCLALRSVDGQPRQNLALDDANYLDTPALAQCPYFRAVLDSFQCEKTAVRLMALEAGAVIKPHRDIATAVEDGLARLHVPLQTDPAVVFRIDDEEVHFSRGDTWYLNASRTHAVYNRSARSRIHLVLDCRVNPWLRQVFAEAGLEPSASDHSGGMPALAAARRAMLKAPQVAFGQLASLRDWYPVAIQAQPAGVWWRHLGAQAFDAAFFSDILRSQPPAQRQGCFSDWAALRRAPDSIAPSAFIFHVSRCGSTLLTRMLSALPSCMALSEPPAIDDFLQLHGRDHDAAERLRDLVHALGQRRDARQRHLLIKLDSWHVHHLALFRSAFPEVPLLFLYRQPLQVLASHQRQRGPQMLPDASWNGAAGDFDRYCLHVVCGYMQAALEACGAGQPPMLLNYQQLPQAAAGALLARLGIATDATGLEAMQQTSRWHAKQGHAYHGDPAPAAGLGAAPEPALLQRSAALYAALESLRLRQETNLA